MVSWAMVVSWEMLARSKRWDDTLPLENNLSGFIFQHEAFFGLIEHGKTARFHPENKNNMKIEHFKSQIFKSNTPKCFRFGGLLQCGGQHHNL